MGYGRVKVFQNPTVDDNWPIQLWEIIYEAQIHYIRRHQWEKSELILQSDIFEEIVSPIGFNAVAAILNRFIG